MDLFVGRELVEDGGDEPMRKVVGRGDQLRLVKLSDQTVLLMRVVEQVRPAAPRDGVRQEAKGSFVARGDLVGRNIMSASRDARGDTFATDVRAVRADVIE